MADRLCPVLPRLFGTIRPSTLQPALMPRQLPIMQSALLGAVRHTSIKLASRKARGWRPRKHNSLVKVPLHRWAIWPRDLVQVTLGKRRVLGQGRVLACLRKTNQVVVEGVNVRRKLEFDRERPDQPKEVEREFPVHYSQVNLVDPVDGRRTRIRRAFLEDGHKVRIGVRSGAVIPRVAHTPKTTYEERISRPIPPFATSKDDVLRVTYIPP